MVNSTAGQVDPGVAATVGDAGAVAETRAGQKAIMLAVTVVPFLGVAAAVALLWRSQVGPFDLVLLAVAYLLCSLGITVGFHRMLTHRAFVAHPALRATLLALGSMAVQGRAIDWAIDHRAHHAHSDREGDPHSPHAGFAAGIGGQARGLVHAHVGWMFHHQRLTDRRRWAKDLIDDPIIRFVDRTFLLWALLGFAIPAAAGWLYAGWHGAVTGVLWGGLVRVFVGHHVTWSVNSICHVFGRRPFAADDRSTNNWLLAVPSLGESWHHNHHVFPSSAYHGLGSQVDISGACISALEWLGLATNVRRVTGEQQARKRRTPSPAGSDSSGRHADVGATHAAQPE
jgi:stearoyl-CoA desaturase (delta-9 desaturase)